MDNGDRHPEHRSCSRATVTILKQKLAAEAAAPKGSRQW
jgi:LmbE family N-acetylglucosaminyl deacetylase